MTSFCILCIHLYVSNSVCKPTSPPSCAPKFDTKFAILWKTKINLNLKIKLRLTILGLVGFEQIALPINKRHSTFLSFFSLYINKPYSSRMDY